SRFGAGGDWYLRRYVECGDAANSGDWDSSRVGCEHGRCSQTDCSKWADAGDCRCSDRARRGFRVDAIDDDVAVRSDADRWIDDRCCVGGFDRSSTVGVFYSGASGDEGRSARGAEIRMKVFHRITKMCRIYKMEFGNMFNPANPV